MKNLESCLILILITVVAATELRCQTPKYPNCTMIYTNMSLWCDHTNLTGIPPPENLVGTFHAEPDKSSILIFAQSCVEKIDKNALLRYQWLIQLDLSGNFIEILQVNTFIDVEKSLTKLKKLYLSRNRVNRVHDNAFKGLTNLQQLHLDGNQIDSVTASTFSHLYSLQELKLSNNKLQFLPDDAFHNMEQLEKLDLSGNQLTMFRPKHLLRLSDLTILNLNSNDLQSFDPDAFLASSKIEEIYLNNNSIKCFPENAFDQKDLSVIQIAGNPLKTPNQRWFAQFIRENSQNSVQHSILLSKSGTWVCDCNAYSYHKFLKTLSDKWLQKLNIECHEPASLRGRMLSEVTWTELSSYGNCSTPDQVLPCPHDVHPSPRTLATTTSTTTTTTTTTPAPTVASTERPVTRTTVGKPVSSKHQSEKLNQNTNIGIIVGCGVIGLLLIVIIFSLLLINKRRSHVQKTDIKPESSPKVNRGDDDNREVTERNSRTDSVEESRGSTESLVPPQMSRPCPTGRSDANLQFENELSQQSSGETNPKLVVGETRHPSVPGSGSRSHIYESVHSSPVSSQPGNSQYQQQGNLQPGNSQYPQQGHLQPGHPQYPQQGHLQPGHPQHQVGYVRPNVAMVLPQAPCPVTYVPGYQQVYHQPPIIYSPTSEHPVVAMPGYMNLM